MTTRRPLPAGPFDVAVVDAPHHFAVRCDATGSRKSPQAHYATMTVEERAALPVGQILARDAVLFFWTTWPDLAAGHAHAILAAWGLSARTGGTWIKRTPQGRIAFGPGYLWRGAGEPILVATRGKGTIRATRQRNVIETFDGFDFDGLRREHSRKPDEFYAFIEQLTPGARRVDLFARQSRPGWTTWGREARKFDR